MISWSINLIENMTGRSVFRRPWLLTAGGTRFIQIAEMTYYAR